MSNLLIWSQSVCAVLQVINITTAAIDPTKSSLANADVGPVISAPVTVGTTGVFKVVMVDKFGFKRTYNVDQASGSAFDVKPWVAMHMCMCTGSSMTSYVLRTDIPASDLN